MKYKKEEFSRFKHLLEYFVAHLEYIANGDSTSTIGYGKYIKPLVDRHSFKSSGQGYNDQAIQTQVCEWEKYQNGVICINVYGPNYQSRGTYLNWKGTGVNIMAHWSSTHIENLYLVYYEPDSGERLPQNVSFTTKDLGLFDGQVPNENICSFFDKYNIMIENIRNKQHYMEINKYIELLKANSNLILTGAPGTGKTYLAKQIAARMLGAGGIDALKDDKHFGFVQFHPSYDYTDFIEGLRPINQEERGNIGFERKDGIFKEFCKCAALDVDEVDDTSEELSFGKLYETLLQQIKGNDVDRFIQRTGKPIFIKEVSSNNNLILIVSNEQEITDEEERTYTVSFARLEKLAKAFPTQDALAAISNIDKEIRSAIGGCNSSAYWAVLNKLWEIKGMATKSSDIPQIPYIFVIDEINRGELSKIFGELFFSIDPGYRGVKGIVNTQYQNLIGEGDIFKIGFYIPENVYIIGTMNDIDRSVESMDFAMRRRFAWQEVTAEESYANMIENDSKFAFAKDEIKARMFNLNKAIAETEGLDEAYQIGAAYFRKYLDYQNKANPFDCLWDNHLKGLLFEYLRGNRRAKELLEKLHRAYNKTSIDEQPAHTNEG